MASARIIGDMRSLCVRDKVGCVIVDPTNRVIATGYNGPAAGFDHGEKPCTAWCRRSRMAQMSAGHGARLDYSDCPSLHAEANALMVSDVRDRWGGTLYVTSDVCLGCAKLIANSRLSRVVVASDQMNLERRGSQYGYDTLRDSGIAVVFRAGS